VGKVTASIDTAHYRGAISKSVRVTANDPAHTGVTLELKADVASIIDVSPTESPIIRTTWGEPKATELTLQATDKKPFDVLSIEADPIVTVTVRSAPGEPLVKPRAKKGAPKPVAAGSSRYLVAIAPKKDTAVGQSIANVTLATNREKAEKISVRAIVFVSGPVQFFPQQIVLRSSPNGFETTVKVSKESGSPFEILGVEAADPDVTATVTPVKKGREYDVVVKYTGKSGRGMIRSRLTVKTNEPAQPTIVIPILGAV
jgi:hypothetical protein